MHPFLRGLGTILVFLCIVLGWIIANSLQVLCLVLMYPWSTYYQRIQVNGFIFRTVNVLVMRFVNPFWTLKFLDRSGKRATHAHAERAGTRRGVLYMINHESSADPWIAAAVIWPQEAKWVVKGSLFRIPIGGWCLRLAGDIEVKFTKEKDGWGTKKGSVSVMMRDSAKLIENGIPIAVFPEGIRKYDPTVPLLEFKPGFFNLALQTQCDIIPIVLKNTHKAWPRGDWKFDRATIACATCERIDITKFDKQDVDGLIAYVHDQMQKTWESIEMK